MFKKIYLFFFAFMLYYHTLIKPAVVCFCVAVHPSVNMHLLETKELYFMKTELSDLCAEIFSEEVLFLPQKIPLLLSVVFFLPLQSSPHSLAEVRFPQCLVAQLQSLQHSNVPQKNDQKKSPRSALPLLLSPAKILHWEHAYLQNVNLDF